MGTTLLPFSLFLLASAFFTQFVVQSFPLEAYHDEKVPSCGVLNYEEVGTYPGEIEVNGVRYKVLGQIQHGATSKVFHVLMREGGRKQCMAVKQVDMASIEQKQQNQVENEVQLLSELNAKGIRQIPLLYAKERHPSNQQISMVLELAHHDLFDEITPRMGKGEYGWARQTLGQILRAMQPVHQNEIVHGDIKPENMAYFLSPNKGELLLKVIDFGGAMRTANLDSACRDIVTGTIMYMSPEQVAWCAAHGDRQFRERQNDFQLSTKSDVWSIGIILYQMLFGHNPYRWLTQKFEDLMEPERSEKVDDELRTVILEGERPIEFADYRDQPVLDMLKKCLSRDPRERPEVEELLEQLEKLNELEDQEEKEEEQGTGSGNGMESIVKELAKEMAEEGEGEGEGATAADDDSMAHFANINWLLKK